MIVLTEDAIHAALRTVQEPELGRDIETLGETVRARVKENSGIELHWEIKRIGIEPS